MVLIMWLHQQHAPLEICTVGTHLLQNKNKKIASSETVPTNIESCTTLRVNMLTAQADKCAAIHARKE